MNTVIAVQIVKPLGTFIALQTANEWSDSLAGPQVKPNSVVFVRALLVTSVDFFLEQQYTRHSTKSQQNTWFLMKSKKIC